MTTNPFRRRLNEIKAGQVQRTPASIPAAEAAVLAAFFEPIYNLIDQMHLASIRFETGAIKAATAFRRSNASSGLRPMLQIQMDARRELLIQVIDAGGSLSYDCSVRELASVASHVRTAEIDTVSQWLADVVANDYARRAGQPPPVTPNRYRPDTRPGDGPRDRAVPGNERRPDQPAVEEWRTPTFDTHPGAGSTAFNPEEPDAPVREPPAPPVRPFRSIDLNEET